MALETETAVETTEIAAQPTAEVPEIVEAQKPDVPRERPSVITVQNGRKDVCLFKLTRRERADVEQEPFGSAYVGQEPIETAEKVDAVERTAFEETI